MVVNNKKVKKVKMAKVYTELKNMDACDDNYQVRQILIKFSYLKENFSGLFQIMSRLLSNIFFGAYVLESV